MPDTPGPFELTDRFGVTWIVKPKAQTVAAGGVKLPTGKFVYDAQLLNQPAYNTNPQVTVVTVVASVADGPKLVADEIAAYIADHMASGGAPPARGTLDVTASRDSGGWLILALLAFVLLGKGKRR